MDPVEEREEPPMMHQPMRPIEISIMQENRARDASKEPSPAVIGEFPVHLGPAQPCRSDRRGPDQTEDHEGQEGVTDFSEDIRRQRETGDDLTVEPSSPEQPVGEHPRKSSEQEIAETDLDRGEEGPREKGALTPEEQIEDVHRGNLEGKKPRDNEIDLRVFHSLIGGGIETRIQGP